MIIRKERPVEFPRIYNLVKTAFETAKVTNGKEQDFVNHLRDGSSYIPELALVAEENGELAGHIMLTKIYITTSKGKLETLLLAPISVGLEYRNNGIGAKLIHESFKLAKELGYTSVLLVGDPAYYRRFGFKPAISFGVKNLNGIPDENAMAYELIPGALHSINGTIDFGG